MKQIQRVNVIMSAVILSFIPAALFAGFTSIPIRQNPRFISNYNSNSTSTYWDRLIVETISDNNTWVAWVNDNPNYPQRCEIRRYNWNWDEGPSQRVHEYVLADPRLPTDELRRWRLWERLPECFGEDGSFSPFDELGIVDMKSCIALDLYGNPRVYVAVVVDILAYLLDHPEPAAHITFIDV